MKVIIQFCSLLVIAFTTRAQPVISQDPADVTVLAGCVARFNVGVSGDGPVFYQWQFNGSNLPSGIINNVADNGGDGLAGNGGMATNAFLTYPNDVTVDRLGNFYITDTGNGRIRRVDTNGIIHNYAGNGDYIAFYGSGIVSI